MDTLKIKESGVTQLNFSELTTYSGGGWWADFKAGFLQTLNKLFEGFAEGFI
ncbi:MAG: hypothetical protein LW721_17375 [Flammeovirgaceae bacterium]|jgi:hypothetical protein|nr:hypothetical protein [Flammeovirgaceae bacterium]